MSTPPSPYPRPSRRSAAVQEGALGSPAGFSGRRWLRPRPRALRTATRTPPRARPATRSPFASDVVGPQGSLFTVLRHRETSAATRDKRFFPAANQITCPLARSGKQSDDSEGKSRPGPSTARTDTETPAQWENLTVCCPQDVDPRPSGRNQKVGDADPWLPHNQKNVRALIMAPATLCPGIALSYVISKQNPGSEELSFGHKSTFYPRLQFPQ
ncbi:uncharacterized protein LOC129548575 [Moschus berezovskii]|uniref:uncharacterized protein LOC129548575 n=1 Tax=Moschus berezovskii TaxID=68408 RepID=UPI0024447335|nr:uncharacterized protein LOC129548575 [Moschus berezovskii]